MVKLLPSLKTLATILLLVASLGSAEARTRALLVGVADYQDDNGIRDLLGPRNDVTLVWRLLTLRGVDPKDIIVLTDGLPDGPRFPKINGRPTHSNITNALDQLARESSDYDEVVFYFSGHGTRQPDNNPSEEIEPEADGYDQVLIPADSGVYDPIKGTIANALVDDELGQKLDAIRAKGSFVWAIVDAPHAAGVARDTQMTALDPTLLNPIAAWSRKSRGGRKGTLVAFYAVDAFDEAIERPFPGYDLPMIGEGKQQRLGVFTFNLHKAMVRGTAVTYADLAREVSDGLVSDESGGRVPQPVFEGDLDHVIFSASQLSPGLFSGYLVDGNRLQIPGAGILQGFGEGARIAIFEDGKNDQRLGQAEISSAQPVSSEASNIAWDSAAAHVKNGLVRVQLIRHAMSSQFGVLPPPSSDNSGGSGDKIVTEAVELAFGKDSRSAEVGINLAPFGSADGDVFLRVANGRLWITEPSRSWEKKTGSFGETPSIEIGDDSQSLAYGVGRTIWLLARASSLVRLAASFRDGGPSDLEIKAELYRGALQSDPSSACVMSSMGNVRQLIRAYAAQGVQNCDVVQFVVTNETDYTYYIVALYIDSRGGVRTLSSQDESRGCANTLYSGSGSLNFTMQFMTWNTLTQRPATVGLEHVVFLAIPQDATKVAPRVCSLLQPTFADTQTARSGEGAIEGSGPHHAFEHLLGGIASMPTRSESPDEEDEGPELTGSLFVFDLRP